MAVSKLGLVLAGTIAVGCGPSADLGGGDGGSGGDGGGADADPNRPDSALPPENAAVYAHSQTALYKVNPTTLDVSLVGNFTGVRALESITDIAIDRDGKMVGVSFDSVYSIDKDTAACTYLADLPAQRMFNGLSFVPGVGPDPNATERLVGAANDGGEVYEINPDTGASTLVGSYGGGWGSSGDIVSVRGLGTLATVHDGGLDSNDMLARLDPTTFAATIIGDTGYNDIWGVGFWENKVFGFTDDQEFILIDTTTGAGQLVEASSVAWWGAAVTTSAPVIE